jgi:uroporphyrinogen-III synthase
VEPLVRIEPDAEGMAGLEEILDRDWVVVTSPAAATVFLDGLSAAGLDVRRIPKLLVAGPGTARVFEARGVRPDAVPDSGFGAEGVRNIAETAFSPGCSVARVASNLAVSAEGLFSGLGFDIDATDFQLYRNAETAPETLPRFEHALFASSSAVRSFVSNFGADALKGRNVAAIGRPTAAALADLAGIDDPAIPSEPDVEAAVAALARRAVRGRVMSVSGLD